LAYVCVLSIQLHFPETASLKGKRRELAALKVQLQRRFGASVAETDHHDLWQRAELTAALVARDPGWVTDRARDIERYLWGMFPQGVRVETRLISSEDLL
jgi:uncharacterized protein YlxP (DUF503 family)